MNSTTITITIFAAIVVAIVGLIVWTAVKTAREDRQAVKEEYGSADEG